MDIGVIGLGLIGGSIAKTIVQDLNVIGFDIDRAIVNQAFESKAITHRALSLKDFARSKVIFVATPPQETIEVLDFLSGLNLNGAVVTDCTGVKAPIFKKLSPSLRPYFVGGHPMAGKELGGFTASTATLFEGSGWILTPSRDTLPRCLEMVTETVITFGARPKVMSPEEHDRIVALVSQLPHIIAAALVTESAKFKTEGITAGSWADLTRVAGSDPDLWANLCLLNDVELSHVIGRFILLLQEIQDGLETQNRNQIRQFFERARHGKINS